MTHTNKSPEFDATMDYMVGSTASFDGIEKAFLRNPNDGFKPHWVVIPKLDISDHTLLSDKPSLMAMLQEYYRVYEQDPCEIAQKFMIEQYKMEFDYWSKTNDVN